MSRLQPFISFVSNNFADIVSSTEMAGVTRFDEQMKSYLHFCRVEKGLAANTLESYRRDLQRFGRFVKPSTLSNVTLDTLRDYLDGLRAEGLAHRSIARHVTTLRNFFQFLQEEDPAAPNPAELLATPKIGAS